jgi:sugar phosphate isomerase/epimerase
VPLAISLAQWSLHRAIRSGRLDPLDFPRLARAEFGLDAVELVSTLLGGAGRERLRRLRRLADGEGVRMILVMVDDEGDLRHPRRRARKRALARHRRWIDAAATLGASAVRVNTGGPPARSWKTPAAAPELRAAIERSAESLALLADHAAPLGVSVLLENHGGLSASIPALLGIIELAGRDNIGTLPDFGNFHAGADPYAAVEMMLPRARAVSAKSFDFDASGLETTIDYPRMLALVLRSGYQGHLGIEYEGSRLDEADGIRRTLSLLQRGLSSSILKPVPS